MKKIIIPLILILASCSTIKYVPVIQKTDSIVYKVKFDSIRVVQHDSVNVFQKGDSVIKTVFHWLYKDRVLKDTVNNSVIKTVDKPVDVYVDKTPSWAWYTLGFSILVLVSFAILLYVKLKP